MKRLIMFIYLTLSVFISCNLLVDGSIEKINYNSSVYDFLSNHKSGIFKKYAELIQQKRNINAKFYIIEKGGSALHKGLFKKDLFNHFHSFIFLF